MEKAVASAATAFSLLPMRFLALHVDYFRTEMTERSRSPLREEPENKTVSVDEALVVLSSVEKADEADPNAVASRAADEIARIAEQLKVRAIVIHSFAHLFAELARPETAILVLKEIQKKLRALGYRVERTPFGWFNTLEMRAKGHPLSRIARVV